LIASWCELGNRQPVDGKLIKRKMVDAKFVDKKDGSSKLHDVIG